MASSRLTWKRNSAEELYEARKELLDEAMRNSFPAEHVSEVHELVDDSAVIFQVLPTLLTAGVGFLFCALRSATYFACGETCI
jgi:hypothetical protein